MAVSAGLDGFDRGAEHLGDVDHPHLEPELAADRARHVEQVVDQPRLRVRVALDRCERALLLRLRHLLRAEDARPAVDRRQRRAQLVRDGHQELVLQVARFFGRLARLLLALERPLEPLVRRAQPLGLDPLHVGELLLDPLARRDDAEQRARR